MSTQAQFGNQVTFIGVPGLAGADEFAPFINRHSATAFSHLSNGGPVWSQFGVTSQRTYVLINDDGTWRRTGYGSLPVDVQGLINS